MNRWNCETSLPVVCTRQCFCLRRSAVWLRAILLVPFVCVLLSSYVSAQERSSSQTQKPVAVVDGQPIYEDQFPAEDQAQLQRMMVQVYAVRLRALHAVLDQKLVEAEAKKKGISTEELLRSEVISKVADPTDEQVKAYYGSRQGEMKEPFDDVKGKIRQDLKDQEISKARVAYLQGLVQQAMNDGELVVLLSPPKVEVTVDPARLRGDPNAPITIVEFSDFSCPYCRKAESTMNELLAKYPGKLRVGYRDFPLKQLHPQAQLAAEASRCAGEQGKYWEYHDLLFASPNKQSREVLIEDARTLKLDDKKFDACLSSGRYKLQIDQDIQLGSRGGVVATPGFFINGTFVNGAQPSAAFEKIIDEQLSTSSQKHVAN
jgi:protein-disulfide isomerase